MTLYPHISGTDSEAGGTGAGSKADSKGKEKVTGDAPVGGSLSSEREREREKEKDEVVAQALSSVAQEMKAMATEVREEGRREDMGCQRRKKGRLARG